MVGLHLCDHRYVVTVVDCFPKKVVGWSIAGHMPTGLVEDALRKAATTTVIEADSIFHSDCGSVCSSADYRAFLSRLGMRSSMSRAGVCWGNALEESFFAALKKMSGRIALFMSPWRRSNGM